MEVSWLLQGHSARVTGNGYKKIAFVKKKYSFINKFISSKLIFFYRKFKARGGKVTSLPVSPALALLDPGTRGTFNLWVDLTRIQTELAMNIYLKNLIMFRN